MMFGVKSTTCGRWYWIIIHSGRESAATCELCLLHFFIISKPYLESQNSTPLYTLSKVYNHEEANTLFIVRSFSAYFVSSSRHLFSQNLK